MIYPDIKLIDWLQRYPELRVLQHECPRCKSMIVTDRPYISKDYVGLEGKNCQSCGLLRNSSSSIPVSNDALETLKY